MDAVYIRVVDVEQPVETHVHAQRDINQVGMALLQPLVQTGQTGDQLWYVEQLLILFKTVLIKDLACHWHTHQIHWRHGKTESRDFVIYTHSTSV